MPSARDELLAIPDDVLRSGQIGQAAIVWTDFAGGAETQTLMAVFS